MSNQNEKAESQEAKTKNLHNEITINKGIEFMLRRRVDSVKPKHEFKLSKSLNLLRRTFHFTLEFSWGVDKPTRE